MQSHKICHSLIMETQFFFEKMKMVFGHALHKIGYGLQSRIELLVRHRILEFVSKDCLLHPFGC